MTQLVIRHYARPGTRRPLWIGLAMAVVGISGWGPDALSPGE